ncbi:MAG: hypothetical protein FWE31_02345 [Firmicutes bacterium]|nr:hypothetical protein [Bacillota bacterium]
MSTRVTLQGFNLDGRIRIGHFNEDETRVKLVSDGSVIDKDDIDLVMKWVPYEDGDFTSWDKERDMKLLWDRSAYKCYPSPYFFKMIVEKLGKAKISPYYYLDEKKDRKKYDKLMSKGKSKIAKFEKELAKTIDKVIKKGEKEEARQQKELSKVGDRNKF